MPFMQVRRSSCLGIVSVSAELPCSFILKMLVKGQPLKQMRRCVVATKAGSLLSERLSVDL